VLIATMLVMAVCADCGAASVRGSALPTLASLCGEASRYPNCKKLGIPDLSGAVPPPAELPSIVAVAKRGVTHAEVLLVQRVGPATCGFNSYQGTTTRPVLYMLELPGLSSIQVKQLVASETAFLMKNRLFTSVQG